MSKTTKEQVIEMVESNSIWLNAFHCINPTDEFLIGIGRSVINMLSKRENLLPKYLDDRAESETDTSILKLAELTPILYLSINKS